MKLLSTALCCFSVLVLATASQATPIEITLSDVSNDPGQAPASDLNAIFVFTVVGTTLTIDVTNTTDTLSLQDYDLSAFNFNLSSEISNLTLTSYPSTDAGWTQGHTQAGGFSPFSDGTSVNPDLTFNEIGLNPDLINPGETGTFIYSFTCTGTCDETDFVGTNSNGYTLAAKFINGGGSGDSAWGATTSGGTPVPEPGTASFLLLGALALFAGRVSARGSEAVS